MLQGSVGDKPGSHSARSAWIETYLMHQLGATKASHSARSAWIETVSEYYQLNASYVALRKECVD